MRYKLIIPLIVELSADVAERAEQDAAWLTQSQISDPGLFDELSDILPDIVPTDEFWRRLQLQLKTIQSQPALLKKLLAYLYLATTKPPTIPTDPVQCFSLEDIRKLVQANCPAAYTQMSDMQQEDLLLELFNSCHLINCGEIALVPMTSAPPA